MGHLKSKVIIAATLTMASSLTQAEIVSVKTMKSAQEKIEAVLENNKAEDVLATFDIDMTLTQPDHPAVYYPTMKEYRDIFGLAFKNLPPEQRDTVNALIVQTIPQKLVEEDTPQIVKDLQEKGVKVIAFTATLTGKLSAYEDKTIFLRREQLQKVGLDFSKDLNDFIADTSFTNFPRYAGSYPMFYQGVLSSNGERGPKTSKGQVLVAFLKHIDTKQTKAGKPGYAPKIIILVDDRMENLLDVEKSLKTYAPSIQFIGIEYQGAYSYAPYHISKEDFQKFWEGMAEKAKAEAFVSSK